MQKLYELNYVVEVFKKWTLSLTQPYKIGL